MSLSQEPPHSLKRDHDSFDFESLIDLEKPFTVPQDVSPYSSQKQDPDLDSGESSMPTPPVSVGTNKVDPSPARSRSASLTDAGSATPSLRGGSPMPGLEMTGSGQQRIGGSPSPSAFAALNGNGTAPPPAKKPKLSFAEREAEKEMKRIQKEIKDRERAEEKARKEQERQAQAEDKARKDAEKEAEKKKKEAEREQKRISQEAEKAAKEEKRRRKEEEKAVKQRAEEAKRKKDGTQLSLGSFFNIPASTAARRSSVDRRSESPAPPSMLAVGVASPAASTPSKKPEQTPYEKMFLDFFVMKEVTMAPINRFERDEEASESLQSMIDSYIVGNRSPGRQRQFDAVNLFRLSGYEKVRGKRCMPVREIMAEMSGKSTRPIDLTTDSHNTQIRRTNDLLRRIPLKFLKFQEDVRPPYRGTYTSRPINGIAKLARNPLRRDLPDTNYDYDSEAEWVEDEDAEDLNSEGDEDEDLGEDGEDMEGFLDDEDDETTHSKRLVLQGDLEPVSTGLCWEDQRKRNTNVKMMPYRMEIILDHSLKTIDPFSSKYWEPLPVVHTTVDPPRLPLNTLKTNSSTVNVPSTHKPVKSFFTPASDLLKLNSSSQPHLSTHPSPIPGHSTSSSSRPTTTSLTANAKPKKLIPAEDMDDFKREVEGSNLSKIGLIEVLKKKFPGRSGAAIKSTLELVAKREGSKEADKRWVIVDESGVA